ncbi:MAG: DsrE family protein [Candidatus Fimivivens sp.]
MNKKKLAIVWISVDKRAAIDMALLYARDSLINGWWKQVELILWGPSVQSAAESKDVQGELELLQGLGIPIRVCMACAVRYGVANQLMALGYEVKGMGEHLTELLAGNEPVMLI